MKILRNKSLIGSFALALLFAAIFVGLRSAPLPQCEIAHYSDSLNAQGELEYCGDADTVFL